jgi:hypothetical protein
MAATTPQPPPSATSLPYVGTLLEQVQKFGLSLTMAVLLLGLLLWERYSFEHQILALSQQIQSDQRAFQAETSRALLEIARTGSETAKTLERVNDRLERTQGR